MANGTTDRILIVGAGVIGSLYGYMLGKAGYDVTVLARGGRLLDLRANGLRLFCKRKSKMLAPQPVKLVEELLPDDTYDYVFVALRRDNLPGIYPALAANASPNIVFMSNNPYGGEEYSAHIPLPKVLMAFPGAAGDMVDGVVHYTILSRAMQPTTVGCYMSSQHKALHGLEAALKASGFPVSVCDDIDSWLLTHAAMICPLTNAIYHAGGTNLTAARSRQTMRLTARALKEAFGFLAASSDFRITPAKLKVFLYAPVRLLSFALSVAYRTKAVKAMMPDSSSHSRKEMQLLTKEVAELAGREGFEMNAFRQLAHREER